MMSLGKGGNVDCLIAKRVIGLIFERNDIVLRPQTVLLLNPFMARIDEGNRLVSWVQVHPALKEILGEERCYQLVRIPKRAAC